ncbi:anti-sigma factor [Solitalea longa]|uniref:Anti-sigma factor n=1 Tax=Solitalea longa TaxID=2079460 RepID=A0A2S5A621_9SPHI|nr:FecR family protein [Solitalea longa]POY38051.1 anti-sigma factor [Solitalea longa]
MNSRLQELLNLYLNNRATPDELDELWDYTSNPLYTNELQDLLADAYQQDHIGKEATDEQKQTILNFIFTSTEAAAPIKIKRIGLWPRYAVASAAAVAFIAIGVWFFNRSPKLEGGKNSSNYAMNDIAPGKQGATLTLSNGKKIRLSEATNGELANEAGVIITKAADGQLVYEIKNTSDENKINTIKTANGETYQVRLPDGSAVWLNAGSSLTYATNLLQNGKRTVTLTGEGYFEVAKDKAHPFIVSTGNQEVEVLGTHFNMNAYADEPVRKTTLLEGSIKLTSENDSEILKPGDQAVSQSGKLHVRTVDAELAVAWKNNKFIFEQQSIQEIMRSISRWYNVEVIYTGEITKETFWGSVSRFDNVSSVLARLEASGSVHFRVEGRRIYVLP